LGRVAVEESPTRERPASRLINAWTSERDVKHRIADEFLTFSGRTFAVVIRKCVFKGSSCVLSSVRVCCVDFGTNRQSLQDWNPTPILSPDTCSHAHLVCTKMCLIESGIHWAKTDDSKMAILPRRRHWRVHASQNSSITEASKHQNMPWLSCQAFTL
jgi:hypothetical protein